MLVLLLQKKIIIFGNNLQTIMDCKLGIPRYELIDGENYIPYWSISTYDRLIKLTQDIQKVDQSIMQLPLSQSLQLVEMKFPHNNHIDISGRIFFLKFLFYNSCVC